MARANLWCVPDDDPDADAIKINRKLPLWVLAVGVSTRCLFTHLSTYAPEGMHVVRYKPTHPTRRRGVPTLSAVQDKWDPIYDADLRSTDIRTRTVKYEKAPPEIDEPGWLPSLRFKSQAGPL